MSWWKEEGPAFLALEPPAGGRERSSGDAGAGGRQDPETGRETAIDAAGAAALMPRGYMIYPSLPEHVTTRQVWRFAVFGARGDIARLLVGAAAATLAALPDPGRHRRPCWASPSPTGGPHCWPT